MNVKIVVKDVIECHNLPDVVKKGIVSDLTFKNPEYYEAKKYGRFLSPGITPNLTYFDSEYDITRVPKGYLFFLRSKLKKAGVKYILQDKTNSSRTLNLTFQKTLRPYQKEAVQTLLPYPHGFLEAKTGAGKSYIGCAMVVERNVSTIIIVHSKELLYQWQRAIKETTGYDCGLLGDGHKKIKDITVGIVNSVSNHIHKVRKRFSYIILDEAHRILSDLWLECLFNIYAKYITALSATPYKRNKLTQALFYLAGPLVHKVNPKLLTDIGSVLIPEVIKISSDFTCPPGYDYVDVIKKLTNDKTRNTLLYKVIIRDLNKYKEPLLFVSDRVRHCEVMGQALQKRGLRAVVLSSKIKKAERKLIIQDVQAGKVDVLLSTLSLIGEGFDSPVLAAIVLGTPVKFTGRVVQVVGRILRPSAGKNKPRLYDICDPNVNILRGSMFARHKTYKNQNWL